MAGKRSLSDFFSEHPGVQTVLENAAGSPEAFIEEGTSTFDYLFAAKVLEKVAEGDVEIEITEEEILEVKKFEEAEKDETDETKE